MIVMTNRKHALQRRAILDLWNLNLGWKKSDIATALDTTPQRVDYIIKTKKGATNDTLGDTTTDPVEESAQ